MISNQQPKLHKDNQKMKLHYFGIRGTCQPIRHLLYYLGIQFEDVVFDKNNNNLQEVFFNTNLPYIVDKDIKVHEAIAIMYYICLKHEKTFLIGHTPQSISRIQEILLKFNVQRKKIMSNIFEMFSSVGGKKSIEEKQKYIDLSLKKLVTQCKFLEYCLKSIAENKKYILQTITLVDFIFYQQCFYICGFFQKYISKQSLFKYFIEFKNNFESLPFFKNKKKEIQQKYLFHAFSNDQINNVIKDVWSNVDYKNILKYDHLD